MSIVTDVREVRGMMEVSLDGSRAFCIRKKHYAARPLEIGEEIELVEYENALASVQFRDAYEAALTMLDFSARTGKEIERALIRKGYVPSSASAVVERLYENRLIDDKRFAERLAESNAQRPVGLYAVKRKLRAKGISEEDTESALECFDEEQQQNAALQAARKIVRRYEGLPVREARAKLSQSLARNGFSWDAVRSAVDSVLSDDFWDE